MTHLDCFLGKAADALNFVDLVRAEPSERNIYTVSETLMTTFHMQYYQKLNFINVQLVLAY